MSIIKLSILVIRNRILVWMKSMNRVQNSGIASFFKVFWLFLLFGYSWKTISRKWNHSV